MTMNSRHYAALLAIASFAGGMFGFALAIA